VHGNIVIIGEVVDWVTHFKYLGLIFDEKLDWRRYKGTLTRGCISCTKYMYQNIKLIPEYQVFFYESCILTLLGRS